MGDLGFLAQERRDVVPLYRRLPPITVRKSSRARTVSPGTLVAPSEKRSEVWLTRDYVEIHTGDKVKLGQEYRGKKLTPQTVSGVLWRHYLHPEHKSLAPDGNPCDAYTCGLLQRRPIEAAGFVFIGKEVERKAQEGEDISVIENTGPRIYGAGRRKNTRPADTGLILRAKRLLDDGVISLRRFMRVAKVSQHSFERFLDGAGVHPATRKAIAITVENLELKFPPRQR